VSKKRGHVKWGRKSLKKGGGEGHTLHHSRVLKVGGILSLLHP